MNQIDTKNEPVFGLMYKDVVDHFKLYHEPVTLQMLSQRYNRMLRRLGLRVIDAVQLDGRYMVRLSKRGSRLVVPLELIKEHYGSDVSRFWLSHGVPLGRL